jgi:hypothetical protein
VYITTFTTQISTPKIQYPLSLQNPIYDTGEKSGENRLPAEFGSWRVELGCDATILRE